VTVTEDDIAKSPEEVLQQEIKAWLERNQAVPITSIAAARYLAGAVLRAHAQRPAPTPPTALETIMLGMVAGTLHDFGHMQISATTPAERHVVLVALDGIRLKVSVEQVR